PAQSRPYLGMTLAAYWKLIVPTKTLAELDADKWLFVASFGTSTYYSLPGLRFSRWGLLLVCCLANLCAGSLLAFVALHDGLDMYFYGSQTNQSVTIQLQTYVWMGLTAAFSGPLVETQGPRLGMMVGTILVAVGFFVAQLAVGAYSPLFLTIGYVS
ncbi:hypothetical protein DYB34_014120, partial [Aphanomyces astaci]